MKVASGLVYEKLFRPIDGIVLFKIAVQIIEDLFAGHLEVIMDETMKSHMGRCLTIHDKLKTDVIAAKRGKLSQRDIAIESKSEKNTLCPTHANFDERDRNILMD